MINKITFSNYRIFQNRQELELKPVTIIFGKNNAGKSAVLKLPLLISNSFYSDTQEVFYKREEKDNDLYQTLRDLVYRRANNKVEIAVEDATSKVNLEFGFFVDITKDIQSRIEHWKLTSPYGEKILQWEDGDLYQINRDASLNISFRGTLPQHLLDTEELKAYNVLKEQQVDYIGPIRVFPKRDLRFAAIYAESGFDGVNTYQVLLADVVKGGRQILKKVSKWYEDNFEGWTLDVDTSRDPVYNINFVKGPISTNLRDTGLGIIQSMPIVVRACRGCSQPTLIELEEPETHLHPAAHANLAELIARSTIEDRNKRYLIETHSQNFILRLRRLIAEGILKRDDVRLYFVDFNPEENSSSLKPVTIYEDGRVNGKEWPEGVFEEALDEVIAINSVSQKS